MISYIQSAIQRQRTIVKQAEYQRYVPSLLLC